jgi:hypothetical protein
MSDIPSNLNADQLDEQLTAYLDGELPPAESRRVEDMLAGDEHARKRLNQLASSWDLLDQLPRAAVDENFSRTTVAMVALSTEEEIARVTAAEPAKRRMRWLAAAVIALLAAGVGFTAVSVATPNSNDALLRDLPVIVNLEFYRPVGSVDLLRKLGKANIFTTDFRPTPRGRSNGDRQGERGKARTEPQAEPEKTIVGVPESIDERRAWIESNELTAEQKLELRRNFERFAALSTAEQASLRELDRELSTADDREQLASIMRRYTDWLKMLTLAERGALEDRPPEKKLEEIEKRKRDWEARMFAAPRLGSLLDFVKRNEAELLKKLPPETRDALTKLKEEERDSRGWRYHSHLAIEVVRNPEVMLPLVTNNDLQPFIDRLPDESRLKQQLNATQDVSSRIRILSQAVKSGALAPEVMSRSGWRSGRRNIDPDRLNELEERLTPEQREKIKGLTGEERTQALMRMLGIGPRGDRPPFSDGPRRGPGDEPPEGFDRKGPPPDGPRSDGQRRGEGFRRGEKQRGERNGQFGRPLEPRPGDGFDRPLPPPDEDRRPERQPKAK